VHVVVWCEHMLLASMKAEVITGCDASIATDSQDQFLCCWGHRFAAWTYHTDEHALATRVINPTCDVSVKQ